MITAPTDIPNLALWLDADDAATITDLGGVVSQWDDKSGNAYHVLQVTESSRPTLSTLNGRTAISFSNHYLDGDLSALLRNVTGATVFAVVRWAAVPVGYQTPFGIKAATNARLVIGTDGTGRLNLGGRTLDSDAWQAILGPVPEANKTYVLTGQFDYANTDAFLHANGERIAKTASWQTATATSDTNSTERSVGALWGGGEKYNGLIAEILVYNRQLSVSERNDAEQYLADRWGATLLAAPAGALVWDTFTDVDGTLLTAHTPEVDTVAAGWVGSTAWTTQSDRAAINTATSNQTVGIDAGASLVKVEGTVTGVSGDWHALWVAGSAPPASGWQADGWVIEVQYGVSYQLYERSGGAQSLRLASSGFTPTRNAEVWRLESTPTSIALFVDDVEVLRYEPGGNLTFLGTHVGVKTGSAPAEVTWDNFSAVSIGAALILTPDGHVSASGIVDQAAGTTSLHLAVDEGVATSDGDATYLVNSASASGEVVLTLSETPTNFSGMSTLNVRVRARRE